MPDMNFRVQAELNSAHALSTAGRFDSALDAYRRALDEDGECAEAWYRKGLLHRQNGDTRLALIALRRCSALSPRDPWPRFQLAQMLWSTGISRRWEALHLFSEAFKLDPHCSEFRLNLGHAQAAVQMLGDAVRTLKPLPEALPSWWAAARDNAFAAWQSARREAKELLARQRGITIEDHSISDLLRLAHLLGLLGRHRPAMSITRSVMRRHPHTWEAFSTHADVVAKTHGPAAAATFLETIRWLFGGDTAFEIAIARFRYENNESDVAWGLLTPSLRSASQDARALASSVLIAMDAGDLLFEHCQQWIQQAPDDTAPYMHFLAAQHIQGSLRTFQEDSAALPASRLEMTDLPLVQFWDSRLPPQEVQDAMTSWSTRNPKLRHLIFNDESARDYVLSHYGSNAAKNYDWCHHPAMKSDVFRIAYLAGDGGVYVDADEYCRRPLQPLLLMLDSVDFIAARSADVAPYLYNAFLLARPGTHIVGAVLQRMFDELGRSRAACHRPDIWHATGPGLLTRAIGGILSKNPEVSARLLLLTKGQYESFSEERDAMAYKQSVNGNWRLSNRGD